jgi:protein-disulfide isomerase
MESVKQVRDKLTQTGPQMGTVSGRWCISMLVFLVLLGGCAEELSAEPKLTPSLASAASQNMDGKTPCEKVRLAIDPNQKIAVVNGKDILGKDLGKELALVESKAWRSYCQAIHDARQGALEGYISEMLVQDAAKKKSQTAEEFVRTQVEAKLAPPTDEALKAFYDKNRRPTDPPFDDVKPSVLQYFQRQQAEAFVGQMISDLRAGAQIATLLEDVGPPALEIDVPAHTAAVGPPSARVTVVEFADFECPYCSTAADAVRELKTKYKDNVRFAYRHFPLSFHPNAKKAAEYSQCAAAQGQFWKLHDTFYANMKALDEPSLKMHAKSVGLNLEELEKCVASGRGATEVEIDMKKAMEIGVEGTPSFYINGQKYAGPISPQALGQAIDTALARQ